MQAFMSRLVDVALPKYDGLPRVSVQRSIFLHVVGLNVDTSLFSIRMLTYTPPLIGMDPGIQRCGNTMSHMSLRQCACGQHRALPPA